MEKAPVPLHPNEIYLSGSVFRRVIRMTGARSALLWNLATEEADDVIIRFERGVPVPHTRRVRRLQQPWAPIALPTQTRARWTPQSGWGVSVQLKGHVKPVRRPLGRLLMDTTEGVEVDSS